MKGDKQTDGCTSEQTDKQTERWLKEQKRCEDTENKNIKTGKQTNKQKYEQQKS